MKLRFFLTVIVSACLLFTVGCATKTTAPEPPAEITNFDGVHERGIIPASRGGPELFAQVWAPRSTPKALVLLLHGTTMHSGVYSQAAKYLATNNYYVYGLDMRGWGRSEGLGSNGYVASPDRYVLDVKLAIDHLKKQFPDRKIYVLGESLGATVALYGYLKYGLPIDGMVFSGPGYKPNVKFLGIRWPRFMHSTSMAMGAELGEWIPSWPTLPSDIGISRVIDDPEMEARLLNDPNVTHSMLPAAYITSLAQADNYNRANIQRLDLPLLVLHGKWDELIPLRSSKELINRAETRDKTLKVYNSNHATMLDSKRYRVYRDIVTWLDRRQ